MKKKKSVFYRIWHWYIKGEYHCDKCPYCWAERTSYEYDEWDAGCYIKGDLCDTCRLIPPFRWIVGTLRKKKAEYYRNHEYDDFPEWHEQEIAKEEKIIELLNNFIGESDICWKDNEGKYYPLDKNEYIRQEAWRFRHDFEDFIRDQNAKLNPPQNPWRKAISWSWHRFVDFFKPYFCK